ncbi:hypothetical protein FZC66_02005 [Priestia megaterium]|nr:hypothetical protein FZC66_02005 [Priestia megaterium]
MKKLCTLAAVAFIGYICHYDIKYGTIPVSTETVQATANVAETTQEKPKSDHFVKVKVKAGDTVLSIIEQTADDSISVSMKKMITDFSQLNNGMSPEDIQIGKTYKFPVYK